MWSHKPSEHSPLGSLFQSCLKKKTEKQDLIFWTPLVDNFFKIFLSFFYSNFSLNFFYTNKGLQEKVRATWKGRAQNFWYLGDRLTCLATSQPPSYQSSNILYVVGPLDFLQNNLNLKTGLIFFQIKLGKFWRYRQYGKNYSKLPESINIEKNRKETLSGSKCKDIPEKNLRNCENWKNFEFYFKETWTYQKFR